ncbi:MAG TPA: prepilin-type N-terminal cleavage/methylation domain-containing protein, partial [Candidatus Methylomirabilis sp.]|nr:prepilin-type N-terminal cleavage/methylation domain-containing protein [Candidatus Methylomirabilis sp.]
MSKKNIPNTKYQILNTNSGFTLLEVIISLFIITILISLFLANYRSGSRSNDVNLAAQKLSSDLRLAQNNALGLVPYNGSLPAGGWGAHFDKINLPNQYIIYADVNADHQYAGGAESAFAGGRTITLPSGVVISDLKSGGVSRNVLDITFIPPDPATKIYYSPSSSSTDASIILKQSVTGNTKNINVNVLGLIETQ